MFLVGLDVVARRLQVHLLLHYLLCVPGIRQEWTLHCRLVEDRLLLLLSPGRLQVDRVVPQDVRRLLFPLALDVVARLLLLLDPLVVTDSLG